MLATFVTVTVSLTRYAVPVSVLWTTAFCETKIVAAVATEVGADVSTTSVRAVELDESTPLSVCLAVTDHVPDASAGLSWQLPLFAVAVKLQVELVPPDVAVTVTVRPGVREVKDTVGVVFEVGVVTVGVLGAEGKLGVS